jgi:hypothetical protein
MLTLLSTIGVDTYNRAVVFLMIAGLIIAAVMLARGRYEGIRRFQAALALSTLAGMVVTSTLLYGYFVDAYAFSLLPLAVFLVAATTGVVAIEIHDVLARLTRSGRLAVVGSLLVLVPIVSASVGMFRPPVAVALFRDLQTEYLGRTFIGPNLGPWMANDVLAFTLTGGRAFKTTEVEPTPEDLRRYAALRDADGTLTYLCLDTLYLRNQSLASHRDLQPDGSLCEAATAHMVREGHALVSAGDGWSILRMHVAGGAPPTTATAGSLSR